MCGRFTYRLTWAQIAKYRERAKQQLLAEDLALRAQNEQRRKTNPGKFDPAVVGLTP